MALLIAGLALFSAVHLIPSLGSGIKAGWLQKMGEGGYKGTFALLLVLSIVLISMGWRSTDPTIIYLPSAAFRMPALALVAVGFFLFIISNRPSRVRQWIRHPQLAGVALWALAHLAMNGDNRSVIVFSTLAVWAVVEMFAINKRDGAWVKTEIPALKTEIISVIITVIVIAIVAWVHPYLSGVPIV